MKTLLPYFLLCFAATTAAEVAAISPREAAALVASGRAVLIDVREPSECTRSGVAAPAVLLPKSDFDGAQKLWKPFLAQTAGKQLILYCHTGRRAGVVGTALAAKGFPAANAGGFADWTDAGVWGLLQNTGGPGAAAANPSWRRP